MERTQYFNNVAQTLLQSFPGSATTDDVRITIYDVNTSTTDVNAAAMTSIGNDTFSYSWTPTGAHTYLIRFNNVTLDVNDYLYAYVVGSSTPGVSGSVSGSSLTTLRKEFLIQVDNYNADDLSGDGSSGDLAVKSINKALQKIYSMVKDSKFMQAYPSTALVSASGTDYIDLGGITDLDEIASIEDTTNKYKLIKIPFWRYREWAPDPSNVTGTPTHYARLFNRIYLYPRPTAVVTYTTDYVKAYGDLSSGSDQALLPSKYNYWIYAEAEVEWYKMIDANAVPQIVLAERERCEKIAMNDIFSGFNDNTVNDSIFGRQEVYRRSLYTID